MPTFDEDKLKEFLQTFTRDHRTPQRVILGSLNGEAKKKYVKDYAMASAERHIESFKACTLEIKKVGGDWIYYLKEGGDPSTSNFDQILANIDYSVLVPLDRGFAKIHKIDGAYSTTLIDDEEIPEDCSTYIICDHYRKRPSLRPIQKSNNKSLMFSVIAFATGAVFLGYTSILAHPRITPETGNIQALSLLKRLQNMPDGEQVHQLRYANHVWHITKKEGKK